MTAAYDIRIRWNGARVRLAGFGFRKLHNLRILDTGLRSIKGRLAHAIGSEDQPTPPLTRNYARFKARIGLRPVRDLKLSGELLSSLQPRYADDIRAIADAGTRKGRIKARVHREHLLFSPSDQEHMAAVAEDLFREQVQQVESVFAPRGSVTRRARRTALPPGTAPTFGPN